jgi:oxidase EvaA
MDTKKVLYSRFQDGDVSDVISRLEELRRTCGFTFNKVPFDHSTDWTFDEKGDLHHQSGKFFSVVGVVGEDTVSGEEVSQPIINQPEHGILGILVVEYKDELRFLLRAKVEPGNYLKEQISPTVQATVSNYQRVHKGDSVPFLEYFVDDSELDYKVLQSEHGFKFLAKANFNILRYTEQPAKIDSRSFLLSLSQLHEVLKIDHAVNMDARSILACFPYTEKSLTKEEIDNLITGFEFPSEIARKMFISFLTEFNAVNHIDEVLDELQRHKKQLRYNKKIVPMIDLYEHYDWKRSDYRIFHDRFTDFNLEMLQVSAPGREVNSWNQPIVVDRNPKINGLLAKEINGLYHFLIRFEEELCSFSGAELSPTIHNYSLENELEDPYIKYFQQYDRGTILHDSEQSEEGGRFFHFKNRYMVVLTTDEVHVFSEYRWLTGYQIKKALEFDCFVNIELRTMISLIQ